MADASIVPKPKDEFEFGDIFDDSMMNFFLMMIFAAVLLPMILDRATPSTQGVAEGYRTTATTEMLSLSFSPPVQSATIRNDGAESYIYFYVNSVDARPIELRPNETTILGFDNATLSVLYYCTRGGTSDFRVDVTY